VSFVETSVVLVIAGCFVTVSSMASITGVFGVVPVHAGAVPVHRGSPPPVAVAVLVAVVAVEATLTGTVMMIGPEVFAAIEQPVKLTPVAGQPVIVPPVAVGMPLKLMPVGRLSASVMAAVVGPFAIAMLMV
jgi:hypothetical protein